MSGEAYDWLHFMDMDELLDHEHDLQRMIDDSAKIVGHYAPDFVQALQSIMLRLRAFRILIEGERENIAAPMKAFNWWQSGDSGEEDFKQALAKWRNGKERG